MTKDFVSFELAKKLKEKGFYYKCVSTYDNEGMLGYNYIQPTSIRAIGFDDCLCSHNVENDGCIDAPTISQVLKWLRKEKKIHIEFVAAAYGYNYIVSDTPEKGGTDRHYSHIKYEGPNDGGAWDEYEEAALAGIEYCLDNLI